MAGARGDDGRTVVYEVSHRTTYRYSIPVSLSHHVLHLTPRPCPYQVCHRSALSITPTPTAHTTGIDYFGNPVAFVTLQNQHKELMLHARSVIEVLPTDRPDPAATMPWDAIFHQLSRQTDEDALDALQYAFESAQTRATDEIRAFAETLFPPGRPVLAGTLALTEALHRELTFDTTATTVSTPLADVWRTRRGVCQDFAHLQLACLRTLRIPARYISGYILTRPPEGKDKLVGADASHAWLSVWCPGHGWVDVDPTNNLWVANEHVTLAWGREYSDISPVNGAIFGGGAHAVEVGVDMVPIGGAG
jgi:transglutaminase-like putative cysteine protease